MNVLILGSGGREHALAYKIAASSATKKVWVHPGNDGIALEFDPLPASETVDAIADVARDHAIDLIVIGPEKYLGLDWASQLRDHGFLVFGPGQEGARLETSKIFAKEFMQRAGIPTARFEIATSREDFDQKVAEWGLPVVFKVDGLAAGKGVTVATEGSDVQQFADAVWKRGDFGQQRVLLEEYIQGSEISLIGLCDGRRFVPLATASDYKRLLDGNRGPNTGGMGSVSPSPHESPEILRKIETRIVAPLLAGIATEFDYRGALYLGLMITPAGDPYVLEFNARFGDPETQALMMRMTSDIVPFLMETAKGALTDKSMEWISKPSAYIVASTEGYPLSPRLGDEIRPFPIETPAEVRLFFSGVRREDDRWVTSGGRVLGAGATGKTVTDARDRATKLLDRIEWDGKHVRCDIGQ